MIGSGSPREWLIPLDTEGNASGDRMGVEERVVGCHTGDYAGLNVCNPQPGFEYQWALNPMGRGGNFDPSAMHAIHRMGGEIVTDGDPEFAMYRKFQNNLQAAPLDSNTVYNELCLVKIPAEALRKKREELDDLNIRKLRRGPEESYVNSASHGESQYGSHGPTRFRLQTHHSELQQGGRAEEILQPDAGVVKSENIS